MTDSPDQQSSGPTASAATCGHRKDGTTNYFCARVPHDGGRHRYQGVPLGPATDGSFARVLDQLRSSGTAGVVVVGLLDQA